MDQLLTDDEVAEMLRVHPATLKNWSRRGAGPPRIKIGAGVRYRLADVEAWITAQTPNGVKEEATEQVN
jgi:predicted DNA-binding transcriptional regulator AlpA